MKKFFKIAGYIAGAVLLIALVALTHFNMTYPKVDQAPDIKVQVTPARLIRGEYLVNHLSGCAGCHSERDWTKYAGPLVPGTEGKGGEEFNRETAGVPGTIYAKNITPAGVGDWSDGELIRAITCGVDNKGGALFPLMPYQHFNELSEEDLFSIVAYVRSLKPIENSVPPRNLDFPVNLLVKTMPLRAYHPLPPPDTTDLPAYGGYLVNAAGCTDCHTEMVKGKRVKGMDFAGGFPFKMLSGVVRSANITPDSATGIGKWTRQNFVDFFKSFDSEKGRNIPVTPAAFNTPMPITLYAGMTDRDLGAMYAYLRTVRPLHHEVVKFTPGR